MKLLLVLVMLLTASPAWATPLTWQFSGGNNYITIDGSFTYESTATPNAYNVHHLTPNVTYALTSWDFTVNNTLASIPSPFFVNFPSTINFSNLLANNTSEFCIGKCIFSTNPYEHLRFNSGEYWLYLTFAIPSAAPFMTTPPDTLQEWGPWSAGASSFESTRNYSILTSGGITGLSSAPVSQPVPELSTWVLVGLGVLGLLLANFQRRLRANHFIE